MEKARQSFDMVAWDRNDQEWDEAQKQLLLNSTCRQVKSVVEERFKKPAKLVPPLFIGGFNILYRFQLDGDPSDIVVRLPCPKLAQFPLEKTLLEVSTAAYISQNTRVPVPNLLTYGLKSNIGPYIILEYMESYRDMSDALATPSQGPDETPVLNPNISEKRLKSLYQEMAVHLLELTKPSFPRIGSLTVTAGGSFSVTRRPITQNMNNMLQLANIPEMALPQPDKTYETSNEWYVAMAEMHLAQLVFQQNDLVTSEDDCRNKYVARRLFYKLARQNRLSVFGFSEDKWSAQSKTTTPLCSAPDGSGSFRLWCDDLRPANTLLDDADRLIAFIDWEFAYAAPTQFVLDPPWWLLLEVPEMWSPSIEHWEGAYSDRLNTWLSAMEAVEDSISPDSIPFKLSVYMRESWETGRFWLNYAARKSWAFDAVFWKFLDKRFFGNRKRQVSDDDLWRTRVHLLSEEERIVMETVVERKMEECVKRTLVEWDQDEAQERLSEVLFD